MSVLLGTQYGQYTIPAIIKRIYPAGFSKRSPLGTEEQRVKVIITPLKPFGTNIGGGYRLYGKFIIKQKNNVLTIPRYSVLQDLQGHNYVFKVVSQKLQKHLIKTGIVSNTKIEVLSGLSSTDVIVKAPSAAMKSGDSL